MGRIDDESVLDIPAFRRWYSEHTLIRDSSRKSFGMTRGGLACHKVWIDSQPAAHAVGCKN